MADDIFYTEDDLEEMEEPDDYDGEEYDEDDIFGYECLGCGAIALSPLME